MSTTPSTLRLRARLVALVALLVAFDVAFVAAVYALAHVAAGLAPLFAYEFESLFWSLGFDYVPLLPVLAVGTPLVLVVQSVFGYRLTLRDVADAGRPIDGLDTDGLDTDGLDGDGGDADSDDGESTGADGADTDRAVELAAERSLDERVARLSQVADVTPPSVRVIESPTPNSFVASRPGERTLFVTTGLLETLDGDRLDAVLGHELAHLKNGDSFVMTAAAFLPTVTARFNERLVDLLRRSGLAGQLFADDGDEDDDSGFFGQFEFALIAFALVALPVVGAIRLASAACYRLLSRVREFAADAGGAAVAGSPAALADALETLTGDARPDEDLRVTSATGVRELCVLPYAIDEADDESADGDEQGESADDEADRRYGERALDRWTDVRARVLPDSHPDAETRAAALRERQVELERAR